MTIDIGSIDHKQKGELKMKEKMRIKFERYNDALECVERQKNRFDEVKIEDEEFEGTKLSVVVCRDR